MAKILPFAKGRAKRKSGMREPAGEIVIFPGIRIEYSDDPQRSMPQRPQRRVRRNIGKGARSA